MTAAQRRAGSAPSLVRKTVEATKKMAEDTSRSGGPHLTVNLRAFSPTSAAFFWFPGLNGLVRFYRKPEMSGWGSCLTVLSEHLFEEAEYKATIKLE